MLPIIYGLILWVVVPGILLAILIFSFIIPSYVSDKDNKVSAIAGFWAGLILFVIYVLGQLHSLQQPDFSVSSLPDFGFPAVVSTVIGACFGFCFLWILKYLKATRLIGLLTLLLSAASSIALFNYIFVASSRGTVMFLAAGVLFGLLFHIVIFPNTLKDVQLEPPLPRKQTW